MGGPGKKENLKPFKKGQSGNLNGRPKKLPSLDVILADVLGDEEQGKSAAEQILIAMKKQAMKGNVKAAELLLDRGYGKVKLGIELAGEVKTVSETKFTIKTKGK